MNIKEKLLFIAVAFLVVFGIGYAVINSVYISRVNEYEDYISGGEAELDNFERRINRQIPNTKQLNAMLKKTYIGDFDEDDVETLRLSRIRLRQLALVAGLQEDLLDLKASPGRSTPGAGGYIQTGWKVSAQGTLDNITKFLQSVSNQDYLQKIDSVIIQPDLSTGNFYVAFRYYTLVLTGKPKIKTVKKSDDDTELIAKLARTGDIDAYTQKSMDFVVSRDVFRPYIKAKPAPPVVKKPDKPTRPARPVTPPKPPVTDVHYRIVGLPSFSGDAAKASVLIMDDRSNSVKEYRPGGEVDSAEIIAVDYRTLPSNSQPQFNSYSRLIIKRGENYYSVDLGDKLSDAAKMETDQLPEDIKAKVLKAAADEARSLAAQQVQMEAQQSEQHVSIDEITRPDLPNDMPEVVSAHALMEETQRNSAIKDTVAPLHGSNDDGIPDELRDFKSGTNPDDGG